MNYFNLYIEFIKIRLQSMIEYRAAFISGGLAQATSYIADVTLIWIMINQFNKIGTWEPYEVLFLYGLNLLAYALAGLFLYNPHAALPGMIKNGEFDELLIRPLNPFIYIITKMFNYGYFSHIIIALVIIMLCFIKLNLIVTPIKLLFLVVVIISGALIQGAAFMIISIPAFWITDTSSLSFFFGSIKEFTKYPISIYPKIIQVFLTIIVPYSFISFYPAQYFLEKNDFLMFNPIIQFISPIIGIISFGLAYKLWLIGIKSYSSTGS